MARIPTTHSQRAQGGGRGRGGNPTGRGGPFPGTPPMPQIIPLPPAFARIPSAAFASTINFSTREGQNLFHAATNALVPDTPFSCEAGDLHSFLRALDHGASQNGWNRSMGILAIPEDTTNPLSP